MTQPTEANSKLIDKSGNFQLGNRQSAIADAVGTDADAIWSGNEVGLVNEMRDQTNLLLAVMRQHGLIAD